ncbi:MAG: ABC transporter ATP-binding protein [Gemmatimonadetes bacterium]|nr:MAG: ABC transporter ATP-binding protein [Gemmatimonadota bacterium]
MNAPVVVSLERVSFTYAGVDVLRDVSFEFHEGDFVGIIGPNAGGKTTLLKLILGLLRPGSGSIRVLGVSPDEARGLVGYVPQYAHFDRSFPIRVRTAVTMGTLGRGRMRDKVANDAVDRALEQVELHEVADRQMGSLSGGQLQRALIARALVTEPKLLLLDEPTASLDTRIGRSVYELLEELAEKITIVLVSHDIGVISRHVRTIACLNVEMHYHHSKHLTPEMIEAAYGCPVDLVAHGHPHRVLEQHEGADS